MGGRLRRITDTVKSYRQIESEIRKSDGFLLLARRFSNKLKTNIAVSVLTVFAVATAATMLNLGYLSKLAAVMIVIFSVYNIVRGLPEHPDLVAERKASRLLKLQVSIAEYLVCFVNQHGVKVTFKVSMSHDSAELLAREHINYDIIEVNGVRLDLTDATNLEIREYTPDVIVRNHIVRDRRAYDFQGYND